MIMKNRYLIFAFLLFAVSQLHGQEIASKANYLEKIKAEKGADYFRNYPSKDGIMGDDLQAMHDTITGKAHGGLAPEAKHVDIVSQSSRRN